MINIIKNILILLIPFLVTSCQTTSLGKKEISTSLNQELQRTGFNEIKKLVTSSNAESASLIILNVETGGILASAYATPASDKDKDWFFSEQPIIKTYEPDAIISPLIISAAIYDGFIDEKQVIKIDGFLKIKDSVTLKDSENFGNITIPEIIKRHSIVALTKIAKKMPERYIKNFLRKILSDSSLVNNNKRALNNFEKWSALDETFIPLGFGLETTPFQLAKAYTIFGNKGKKYKNETELQIVDAKTATAVKNMMSLKNHDIIGVMAVTKMSISGGYSESYSYKFTGLYPIDSPKIVFCIVLVAKTMDIDNHIDYQKIKAAFPLVIKNLKLDNDMLSK